MPNLNIFASRLRLIFWLLSLGLNFLSGEAFAVPMEGKPTHCGVEEYSYFSCRLKDSRNVASLCGHVLEPLVLDNTDIAVIFRSGVPKGSLFKYPQHPVSIKEGKFIGHHERPYQGGYSSDEVSFYVGGVSHGVYVIDENGVISGSVAGKGPRASLCAPGSITNSLWQLIISFPDPAKK